MGLSVNLMSRNSPLLLDKFILLDQTLRLLLPDRLFTELSLIVVLLTHAVKIVLHLLFLSANLFNSSHLLVPEIFVAEVQLLPFPITALASRLAISFLFLLTLLLLTTALHNLVVVLVLKVL